MNLNDLQIALLDNDSQAVRSVIDEIDRATENEMFRRAGEHFGFITAEAGGRRIAFLPELAAVFAYSDASGLRKLVERYRLEAYFLAGYGQNVRQLLLQAFGIHKFSPNATFITWSVFLVAGMVSTTDKADLIKRYLLDCERAARIGGGLIDATKARRARLDDAGKVITFASRADRIRDANLRLKALQHLDAALDGALAIPQQDDLFKK